MATSTGLSRALINDLLGIYIDAENKMLARLASRAKRGATEEGWTEQKFSDVKKLRDELESILGDTTKLAKTLTSKGIIDAYKYGVNSASKQLGMPLSIMKDLIPFHVQRLILDTHNLVEGASVQILRNTQDAYRDVIAETSTGVLVGTDTRMQATQDALNRFAAKGITGFIDKAGRKWEMASYTEMAIRTATARAALQGHIDRQTELGYDLMIVSSIGTTCPICSRWQGKVLSISGNDPKYPSLQSAMAQGLFHPNCKHTIMAWYESVDDAPQPIPARSNNEWLYEKTQEQRSNERQIRKWKRMEAVALTPMDKLKAENKIKYWQARQRELIRETGLRREYGREGIKTRQGDPAKVLPTARKAFDKSMPLPKPETPASPPPPPFPEPSKYITLEHLKKTQDEFVKDNNIDLMSPKHSVLKSVLEAAIDNGELRMRIPGEVTLNKIIDTKFMNQMEVGSSRGSFDPSSRKTASKNMFGTDLKKAKDSDYEIYGYLGDKNVVSDAIEDSVGRGPSQYGDIILTFKRENVFHRSTFTVDDSLGPALWEDIVASKLDDIVTTNIRQRGGAFNDIVAMKKVYAKDQITPSKVVRESYIRYLEVQYHGGLTMDDVASVVTHEYGGTTKLSEKTVEKLKAKGIKVQHLGMNGQLVDY